jgi:hypothetical protein
MNPTGQEKGFWAFLGGVVNVNCYNHFFQMDFWAF